MTSSNSITDMFVFARQSEKTKTRFVCVASTQSYPNFESYRKTESRKESPKFDEQRAADLVAYFNETESHIKARTERRADRAFTLGNDNISSVYIPEPNGRYGYGDVKGTNDALLFDCQNWDVINGRFGINATVTVYVCRGLATSKQNLYGLLKNGELDSDIEKIKQRLDRENAADYFNH